MSETFKVQEVSLLAILTGDGANCFIGPSYITDQ